MRCLYKHSHVTFFKTRIKKRFLCTGDSVSNVDYAALRAMTSREGESAVMLFVIFPKLLKPCGAIHNFACFPKALSLVVVSSFPKALPLG
jgi:hypothetical protein